MRCAGRPSWSVRENTDERLHALLHVRQTLVGGTPVTLEPPALRHRPAPAGVPADRLPAALAAWDDWWRDAVALAALEQGVDVAGAADAPAWARATDPFDASDPRWPEPFPGMVLCSFDAALHERTSRTMMRAAFTARLL